MTDFLFLAQKHPLFAVLLTLSVYAGAQALWQQAGRVPLLHPVLVTTLVVGLALLAIGMSYEDYRSQVAVFDQTLGLVIVLLAVPLYRQGHLIRASGGALMVALLIGSCVAIASTLAVPSLTGATELLPTFAPRSATTPVAVEVSESLGGAPALTALVVIGTGIFGGVFGPSVLRSIGVTDDRASGFALGLSAHAIGTARAIQISGIAGAFASLGMVLNALLTIVLAPIAVTLTAP